MILIKKREALRRLIHLRLPFLCSIFTLCISPILAPAQDLTRYSEMIRDGNVEQKREALFQIRNLRSPEASRLAVPALKDPNPMIRATAAASVVFLPPTEARMALLPLLGDTDEFVRREVAYALGQAGNWSATRALIGALNNDKSLEVRVAAAVGLGGIGDVSAIEALSNILKRPPLEDEEFLRRSAARAVGQTAQRIQTGTSEAITPQNYLPERYKRFREKKHGELVTDFPEFKPAVPLLITVLGNTSESMDTRREAAYALGAIGDPAAVSILEKHLADEDNYLAEICREALLKIKHTAANLPL